ncbi:MAG: family 2 glycosyl transferase, partial [Lapillicoccus sp.]
RVNPDDAASTPHEARLVRAFDPMQSGWVVPVGTFDRVGLLEEDLVIDGVDSEFTARCRAAGLDPVVGAGCALEHGQGERMPARLLGRPVAVRGVAVAYNRHAPARVYYMTRNGTIITRRYLVRQPRWVLRRLGEEALAHVIRLAFDPQRGRLVVAILAGWRDGLLGRTGRIPADLEQRLR